MSKFENSKAHHLIYAELLNAVRYSGLTNYTELARIAGLAPSGNLMGKQVGEILELIGRNEAAMGRPMLTALCVSSQGTPGPGFYGLAESLGHIAPDADTKAKRAFWERECSRVYAEWSI